MTKRRLIKAELYWDTATSDEGWAERTAYDDGHQESGPWDAPRDLDTTGIEDQVVEIARQGGVIIDGGSVGVEHRDGGYGCWTAE